MLKGSLTGLMTSEQVGYFEQRLNRWHFNYMMISAGPRSPPSKGNNSTRKQLHDLPKILLPLDKLFTLLVLWWPRPRRLDFHHLPLVCLFVSRITQNLLNGSQQSLLQGWDMGWERTHYIKPQFHFFHFNIQRCSIFFTCSPISQGKNLGGNTSDTCWGQTSMRIGLFLVP